MRSLVPTCRDHCDESRRALRSLTAERKLITRGAHNNTLSVITITAIVTIIFIIIIIIIIIIVVIFQSQPGPPCCLCSARNQRNRRLVRCQIFDKSPQCSQRPWTRGQIPQLTKGGFYDTGRISRARVRVRTCARAHRGRGTEVE